MNFLRRAIFERMTGIHEKPPFVYGKTKIPLQVVGYGSEEVLETLDSLMSGWMTMGAKVKRFEQMWADYCGVKYAIMTNSGSSANLLAIMALRTKGYYRPDTEIITPALTWATTVFPIAQAGYVPVLVDVDRNTMNIDPKAVEAAITPKTTAIMPVHLLGNPCDMLALQNIAREHGLAIIEDACEAHGAEYQGQKVGSFGHFSTFSFFFSHHISTIEGGMVLTNTDFKSEMLRSFRAFGWAREVNGNHSKDYPDIDPRFLFLYPGYNFRPTEMQGAFGIHQVPKLEGYIAARQANAYYWNEHLPQKWLQMPTEEPGTRHAWFAYPFVVKEGAPFTAKDLMRYLEECGVETRPIEAGDLSLQPAMKHIQHRVASNTNARFLHHHGFFIGNNQAIGAQEREAVVGYVEDFMRNIA